MTLRTTPTDNQPFYSVVIRIQTNGFDNREHPNVAQLALRHCIEHDGGEGAVGVYNHHYYTTSPTIARDFAIDCIKLGFMVSLNHVPAAS